MGTVKELMAAIRDCMKARDLDGTVALCTRGTEEHPEAGEVWRVASLVEQHRGDFEPLSVFALLRSRAALSKFLTLPVGWTARFDGHVLTSVTDEAGEERWAVED